VEAVEADVLLGDGEGGAAGAVPFVPLFVLESDGEERLMREALLRLRALSPGEELLPLGHLRGGAAELLQHARQLGARFQLAGDGQEFSEQAEALFQRLVDPPVV
jgi:hypothetical protein